MMRMVKRASSWDDKYTQMIEDAATVFGRDICGAKIPEPKIDENEPMTAFKKRFEAWEKMPYCIDAPVSDTNGRCEKHGGLSTGAGARIGKRRAIVENDWSSKEEDDIIEIAPEYSLIPLDDTSVEITETQVIENPYIIGSRVISQLSEKGWTIPELIEPLIQNCQTCQHDNECPYFSGATGKCQYERRIIYETFGEQFSKNPYADIQLVYALAMSEAELFRTKLLIGIIGIAQASKQKIIQEKKSLSGHVLALKKQLELSIPKKLSQMSDDETNDLLNFFKSGETIELTQTEKKVTIKPKDGKEVEIIDAAD